MIELIGPWWTELMCQAADSSVFGWVCGILFSLANHRLGTRILRRWNGED